MPLDLYTSNRMERLVDALGDRLARPLRSAFDKEWIIVQSRGMQRWLSLRLASRFGVWANGHYPFPNALIMELFAGLGLERRDATAFSPDVMTWKIMRLLPELIGRDAFVPLRTYLLDDHDGMKCYQLAATIADTFDQYTLFRPEMLAAWEAFSDAPDGGWQAVLWRALVSEASGKHRGQLKGEFCDMLRHESPREGVLPERISLFGISSLPSFHLDVLSAVAAETEVNLFLLSPTQEYWGDIVSRKALARMDDRERELRTEGNPLLASLGKSGRDFSEMLIELSDKASIQQDLYEDPGDDTLLHALQSDMLNLSGTGEEGLVRELDPADRSVQVHSCHSALREIEILHDNLLDLLQEYSGLTPRDIVVMAPDIEAFSPYIAAVFGAGRDGTPALPYSIADRRLLNEGEIASAVLKLLDLHGSRLEAPKVFDLLASPPVSRRFGLDARELETIRFWIEETRIRWGMDEAYRSSRALPSYRQNSWRAGLDRLMLGFAMPDEGELYEGILPYGDMEGSVTETLGKFADFLDAVDTLVGELSRPATLEGWKRQFLSLLETFILPGDDSGREMSAITAVAEQIGTTGTDARFTTELSPAVMLSWLRSRIELKEQGLGFMTGGITFCAMLPMRSIPFRVVALIGMNDGAFPRQSHPPGFDLIAREPQRGDRSTRGDDRYLFLESILSARDVLYISHVGQSIRDNSEIPPSVLVSELLDAVRRGFVLPSDGDPSGDIPSGGDPSAHLVVRHRLQPFHPAYFTPGSGLFSYSAENCRALALKHHTPPAEPPFLPEPLAPPPEELKTISLERLLRFYDNPARYFLEQRLGIRIESAALPLGEREPFGLEGFDAYAMKQELLELLLKQDQAGLQRQDRDAGRQLELFRSRGMLPPAEHGERVFRLMLRQVQEFARTLREKTGGLPPLASIGFDLQIDDFRLTGRLDRIWPQGRLYYRCATMKPKDRLRAWIGHLVLNAACSEGYPHTTELLMRGTSKSYKSVERAEAHLGALLRWYWQGQLRPLPFFPGASIACAEKSTSDEPAQRRAACSAWDDGFDGRPGEGSDPAVRRCFGVELPFDALFCTIAGELLFPMIDSEENTG